jgi:plastocyanin
MRRYGLLVLPLLIVVGLGFVGVTVAGGGDGGDDPADTAGAPASDGAVTIADFAFDPVDATVPAGTAVTWTNTDGSPHSIQDDSGQELFAESDDLDGGDTFSFTYEQPGTYDYICGIHNYMRGTVTVS